MNPTALARSFQPPLEEKHVPKIVGLQFCVLSEEDILRRSVVEVKDPTLYVKNLPKENGVNDHRMGTVDRRYRCGTCGQDVGKCNGHIGHIRLPIPLYHFGFLDHVLKILRMVCFFCSRLTLPLYTLNKKTKQREKNMRLHSVLNTTSGFERFFALKAFVKAPPKPPAVYKRPCPHCKGLNPWYTLDKQTVGILIDWSRALPSMPEEDKAVTTHIFTSAEAYSILKCIRDSDAKILGFDTQFARPKDLMISVLLVPPCNIRPVIMQTDQSKSKGQDDLTKKLNEIVKSSNKFVPACQKENLQDVRGIEVGQMPFEVAKEMRNLQGHMATYFRQDAKGAKAATLRSGAPMRCLWTRLKGKGGRFRNNLMGKRTNFSARTVASPDTNIDVDEIGVPMEVALVLTIPERVTELNRAHLAARVLAGAGRLDGANTVITNTGTMINLHITDLETRQMIRLQTGWIVERPLNDGDYVIHNRQPSLHKKSILAHRVRVMPTGRTFRINVAATSPYNADFDGDETNLHAPQSLRARAEMCEIMAVDRQMLNAQNNKPIIGLVQDSLVGSFCMTRKDTFLTRERCMQLLMSNHYGDQTLPPPAIQKPCELWTGKQIYSCLFPPIFLKRVVRNATEEDPFSVNEDTVVIRNGELLCGALCKQTLGTTGGGIIHVICKDQNRKRAVQFISDAQRMVIQWMGTFGFSVGIRDCMIDAPTESSIQGIIQRAFKKIELLQSHIANSSVPIKASTVEGYISQILCKIIDHAGRMVQSGLGFHNRIFTMATAGSKGSAINTSQIAACVGQQSVEGRRIRPKRMQVEVDGGPEYDEGPENCGFVANSYTIGLEPTEFFHHAMGGREGLVDTAVKTARTGYLQRRLEKAMEAMRAHFDGSVRNAEGYIVQYAYGVDALDAEYLEKCKLHFLAFNNAAMKSAFTIPLKEIKAHPEWGPHPNVVEAQRRELEFLMDARDTLRRPSLFVPEIDATIYSPVNCARRLESVRAKRRRLTASPTDASEDLLTPCYVVDSLDALCVWLDKHRAPSAECFNLKAYVRSTLCSRRVTFEDPISRTAFDDIVDSVKEAFERCHIDSGEMVGSLAAESVGEPCTQLTLNSVEWGTQLVVRSARGEIQPVAIGAFVDSMITHYSAAVQLVPTNRTELLTLTNERYTIPSVDAQGRVHWKRITAVTRHHPVGNLLKITTASGRRVVATRQKSFLRWREDTKCIEECDGTALRVGDQMPVQFATPQSTERRSSLPRSPMSDADADHKDNVVEDPILRDNFEIGYLLGVLWLSPGSQYESRYLTVRPKNASVRQTIEAFCRRSATPCVYDSDTQLTSIIIPASKDVWFAHPRRALLNCSAHMAMGMLKAAKSLQLERQPMPLSRAYVLAWVASTIKVFVAMRFVNDQTVLVSLKDIPAFRGHDTCHDVVLDPILSIEEHVSGALVYDLTVEDTLNFGLFNGLHMRDTFHFSGVASKNVTLGEPRLRELINNSKDIKTPSLTVVPLTALCQNPDTIKSLSQSLVHTLLSDVVDSDSVVYDPDPDHTKIKEDQYMVDVAQLFRHCSPSQRASNYVIRLVLDMKKVRSRNLLPSMVAHCVRKYLKGAADVIYSHYNSAPWVVRIRLNEVGGMIERLPDGQTRWQAEQTINHQVLGKLLTSVCIGGIPGVHDASVRQVAEQHVNEKTGALESSQTLVIDTKGTALMEVWMVDAVDWTRTITNDVNETCAALGIEAAAALLFNEIKTVLSFDGGYVDKRHIRMVVDTMCFRGYIMALTRDGLNKVDTGTTARASFEKTMEVLLHAGAHAENDRLTGVTENIITGQRIPMGTGVTDLFIDPEYAKSLKSGFADGLSAPKPVVFRSVITEWGSLDQPHMNDMFGLGNFDAFNALPPPPDLNSAKFVSADSSGWGPGGVVAPMPPPDFFGHTGLPSQHGMMPMSWEHFSCLEDPGQTDYRPSSPCGQWSEADPLEDGEDDDDFAGYKPSSPSLSEPGDAANDNHACVFAADAEGGSDDAVLSLQDMNDLLDSLKPLLNSVQSLHAQQQQSPVQPEKQKTGQTEAGLPDPQFVQNISQSLNELLLHIEQCQPSTR